jgi:hypothetical protein
MAMRKKFWCMDWKGWNIVDMILRDYWFEIVKGILCLSEL